MGKICGQKIETKRNKMGRHLTHASTPRPCHISQTMEMKNENGRHNKRQHIVEPKKKDGEIGRIKRKVETKMKSESELMSCCCCCRCRCVFCRFLTNKVFSGSILNHSRAHTQSESTNVFTLAFSFRVYAYSSPHLWGVCVNAFILALHLVAGIRRWLACLFVCLHSFICSNFHFSVHTK